MSFGKNEKILFIVLIVLVYLFVLVKFIVLPGIPQINTAYKEIAQLNKEKVLLDSDIKKMNEKKVELQGLKLSNEKLQSYLPDNMNMTDGIDYLNKLSAMLGEIEGIRIFSPVEKVLTTAGSGNQKYYEMKLNFTAKLNYEDTFHLLKYLEGNALKVTVSAFKMTPVGTDKKSALDMLEPQNELNSVNNVTPEIEKETLFDINMTVSLYSFGTASTDKLYEFSRNTFYRYRNPTGDLFIKPVEVVSQQTVPENQGTTTNIIIEEKSYMTAGPNLEIASTVVGTNILRVKTNNLQNLTVLIVGDNYKIETMDENGKLLELTGLVPAKDLKMEINLDIPDIKENKNLRLKVKIVNNTKKKLTIILKDMQKRVDITDRKGSSIFGNSSAESVTVL